MLRFKYLLLFTLLILLSSVISAQDRVTSLAVLVPEAQNLAANQNYLPAMIQGELVSNLTKHSNISILDRMRLETVLKETESGIYKNEADFGRLGEITNVEYALTGRITRTGTGFTLQLQVVGTGKDSIGKTRASYSGSVTIADLDNLTGVRKASLDLMTQMGVTLTASARQELSGAGTTEQANAQNSLARGITAQKGGTVVEALSYYIQASNYDPSLAEAASRVNVLSANISSGNIGDDTRNDIAWRRDWVQRLQEAEKFFTDYTKQNQPYFLIYDTDITWGNINYQNETIEAQIRVELLSDEAWAYTLNEVMKTIKAGFDATGRAKTWGLDWPSKPVSTTNPFVDSLKKYSIGIEILNSNGISLFKGNYIFDYGFKTMNGLITTVEKRNVNFRIRAINANLITDQLSIRITNIDGIPIERASSEKRISIMTFLSNEYEKMLAERTRICQAADASGHTFELVGRTIVSYTGKSKDLIIPPRINGVSITRIGNINGKGFLTSVIIPEGVTVLSYAFDESPLTSVVIPSSVTEIWDSFRGASLLTSITIGKDVFLGKSFYTTGINDFHRDYYENGRKAGVYRYHNNKWRYTPLK